MFNKYSTIGMLLICINQIVTADNQSQSNSNGSSGKSQATECSRPVRGPLTEQTLADSQCVLKNYYKIKPGPGRVYVGPWVDPRALNLK